ncbi:SPOR domain-containing protein [Candidimonas humi]|uniref:SPOR domain-containing protein n=1 Tax=Candidimonas humi TaxID=683355 RepID=A0ABV8P0A2_9BURK|nr:SPOR domain-containing protein [Candidimonas humi]MBV6304021.1 SPOR domain-containing protein [Candidimonas humi]
MAKSNRKSSGSRSGGNTLFAMLAGLIIGLAVAAGVAVFVMRAPMPFVDHATRAPAQTALLPNVKDAPDPNLGLYGADGGAGTAPGATGPVNTAPKPLPGNAPHGAPAPSGNDNISKLIATLTDTSKPAPAQGAAPAAHPRPAAPDHPAAAQPKSAAAPKAAPAPGTQTTYYLQAGSFHSSSEAEAVKARILMLGLPVAVQKAQVNGSTVNRVRVGPFKGIDEMNRSRSRLGEEQIASTVVRQ